MIQIFLGLFFCFTSSSAQPTNTQVDRDSFTQNRALKFPLVYGPLPNLKDIYTDTSTQASSAKPNLALMREKKIAQRKKIIADYEKLYLESRKIPQKWSPFTFYKINSLYRISNATDPSDLSTNDFKQTTNTLKDIAQNFERTGQLELIRSWLSEKNELEAKIESLQKTLNSLHSKKN